MKPEKLSWQAPILTVIHTGKDTESGPTGTHEDAYLGFSYS